MVADVTGQVLPELGGGEDARTDAPRRWNPPGKEQRVPTAGRGRVRDEEGARRRDQLRKGPQQVDASVGNESRDLPGEQHQTDDGQAGARERQPSAPPRRHSMKILASKYRPTQGTCRNGSTS